VSGYLSVSFVFHTKFNIPFSLSICCVVVFFPLVHNALQLGEVAEIEAQMFRFAQKFNRRTFIEFSTEPAILPNCCYVFALFAL
jgi:hypothetical protein